MSARIAWLALLLAAAGCGRGGGGGPPATCLAPPSGLVLTSAAFAPGAVLPRRHTADGAGLSPPLSWSGAPAGAKSFALVVDDPDAPLAEPFVHWLLYNIPAGAGGLPEGAAAAGTAGRGTLENHPGYFPPAPPAGDRPHRYRFVLYALDLEKTLAPGLDRRELAQALAGHVLAQAELVGRYGR